MSKKPKVTIKIGTSADLAKYGEGSVLYVGDLPAGTTISARTDDGEFYATHPDQPVKLVGFRGIRPLAKDGVDG